MTLLSDSSEIREAARLVAQILKPVAASSPEAPASPEAVRQADATPIPATPAVTTAPEASAANAEPVPEFRQDRLELCLAAMCRRGGLTGAVVADDRGFPLIVHNSPVGDDVLASFTTVLGDALEKAGTILGQHGAETISMDINYAEKIVLHRFVIADHPYYMMVLCPQDAEERSEVVMAIEQITAILTGD
jgi:hypothetical protein